MNPIGGKTIQAPLLSPRHPFSACSTMLRALGAERAAKGSGRRTSMVVALGLFLVSNLLRRAKGG